MGKKLIYEGNDTFSVYSATAGRTIAENISLENLQREFECFTPEIIDFAKEHGDSFDY